jgi:hypothetical protein
MLLGTLLTLVQTWRKPQHFLRTMGKTFVALAPILILATPLAYASGSSSNRYSPTNAPYRFASLFGAAVMGWQVQRQYPNRLESTRLVMFYDTLQRPEYDLKALDAHVARMETLLGQPLREKIWWVRGALFGRAGVSFLGLSLGSEISPATNGNLDRHELAHGVIEQLRPPNADPPAFIIEGWAEAQSGATISELADQAVLSRKDGGAYSLAELSSPAWYYRHDGAVYSIGGAFSQFVLQRYGVKAFLGLYTRTNPRWFLQSFPIILGAPVEDVERDFWKWVYSKEKKKNGRASR